jgi:hypothetical protein
MANGWQLVAFPLILPWRPEFYTLPLYFPDLQVGVIPGWPADLPYQGLPLPPEAQITAPDLKHYQPGELRQWQAFADYQQSRDEGDLVQALKGYAGAPPPPPSETAPRPDPWTLAWQLEKMQADQEAQLLRVDQGQDWLTDIIRPEPWSDPTDFGPAPPGVEETVDPELAQLRHRLWQRVMGPHLEGRYAPVLLGRASRAAFLTLRGGNWTALHQAAVVLPGVRSLKEWRELGVSAIKPPWQPEFNRLLADALESAAGQGDLPVKAQKLQNFVDNQVTPQWPLTPAWQWRMEIWTPDGDAADGAPVLCWRDAGRDILPG